MLQKLINQAIKYNIYMKHLFTTLFACLMVILPCHAQDYNSPKYLGGAVPTVNGFVVFSAQSEVPGRTKDEIFKALETYTKSLLQSEMSGTQCRITELTPEEGIIAASIEEELTFKRTNWVHDYARFFYQLVFEIKDGEYTATMRRIRYLYSPMDMTGIDNTMTAEDWITDKEAINRKGKLNKVGGRKFRYATINRKDEIFSQALKAAQEEK